MKYIVQLNENKYAQRVNGTHMAAVDDIDTATIYDENDDYEALVQSVSFAFTVSQVEILDPFTAQYHLTDLVNL